MCVCVCDIGLNMSGRVQEKYSAFWIISSKKWSNHFLKLYYQDRLVITNLPICVKLLYKDCSQKLSQFSHKKSP
jgi:hypothetical protein